MASILESAIGRVVIDFEVSKIGHDLNSLVRQIDRRLHRAIFTFTPFLFEISPICWSFFSIFFVIEFALILFMNMKTIEVYVAELIRFDFFKKLYMFFPPKKPSTSM